MKRQTFNRLIATANFAELFITEMAWNIPTGPIKLPPIEIDSVTYCPNVTADKCGFKILLCEVDTIPTTSVCRRIDLKVRRFANDYIMIFIRRSGFHHLWLVPVRKVDKRDIVTTEYTTAGQSEFLFEKIDNLAFAFDERVTITDVRQRVQESFIVNSEKITKDFYAGFRKEHKAFVEFISGIEGTDTATRDRQWYASVMLNRLMFCYFIQKKGFLNNNTDYLQDKLKLVQRERGEGHFFRSFYIGFLRGLFHNGLNTPRHDEEFEKTYGRIPYLNGGMFDEHKIERDYADIDIADEAFERLFKFFDRWNWHLDTRITASGKDINPDVLGYIFEQYINDRAQMGAYYTKEDITEYIGRNCILPYLFDAVRNATKESARDFTPDGFVWQTLRRSSDRYIFDAVRHGADAFNDIPDNIRRGIITDSMHHEYTEMPIGELPDNHIPLAELRRDWNTPTPEKWGLPTEIWRESIDRMQRALDIKHKIENGEITSINNFITYNLDIRAFAHDLLATATDHLFIKHFYQELKDITILDPTCGSGAFLFAAMNILEPLYEVCIDRIQEFNEKNPKLFKDEIAEITGKYRSNIQYFIYKSIILRNLYGVDIMVEATEIAKLRLFLKMVAVVEVDRRADNLGLDPLPDIDFNIRCGNTLVGYANKTQLDHDLEHAEDILQELANQEFKQQIDEEMQKVDRTYKIFKDDQLQQADDMFAFKQAKHNLHERLYVLNDQLNRRLFLATTGYRPKQGEDFSSTNTYRDWLSSHQPFHWLTEFYQIIESNHGFDVIIGNPPYVEYNKKDSKTKKSVSDIYRISNYDTLDCGNLYAYVIERCIRVSNYTSKIGVIIPSSSVCTPRMSLLSNILQSSGILWTTLWDERPATLFDGVCIQLSIQILSKDTKSNLYTSAMYHWNSDTRPAIFKILSYTDYSQENIIAEVAPKINSKKERTLADRIFLNSHPLSVVATGGTNKRKIYYKNAGGRYWRLVKSFPTYYKSDRGSTTSTEKTMEVSSERVPMIVSLLSSSLFYWYWRVSSNCRHLTNRELDTFPVSDSLIENHCDIDEYHKRFEDDLKLNKERTTTHSESKGDITQDFYYVKYSKSVIDKIDSVLAYHYGFTDEELDFIINYDIKYRMGDELNNYDK